MTRLTPLRFAALLILLAPVSASAQTAAPPPAASAAGYHWRTLALRHAVPSDILALMHWGGPAPSPPALPDGVRRIFALRSTNSLLVQATESGFVRVASLVTLLDRAPLQVKFHMALVAVPAARAGLYTPDMPASELLSLLLAGEASVISVPSEIVTQGTTANVSVTVPATAPIVRFRMIQAGPGPGGRGPSARCEFRLTPLIGADGTVTLSLMLASMQAAPPRTLRAGELAAYDVTGATQMNGKQIDGGRLFLFLSPTIIADTGDAPDAGQPVNGQSVTVTP